MKNAKRGKNVALVGFVVQVIIAAALLILWRLTDSRAVLVSLWMALGGVGIWLITVLLFYARQLQARETIELEEMTGQDKDQGIFEERERLELRPAYRRVIFLQRWIVPVFTLLLAGYLGAIAVLMFKFLGKTDAIELSSTAPATVFLILLGFGAFLFSRYCTGMSRQSQWRLLRAAGSFMLICAMYLGLLAVALLFHSMDNPVIERIAAYVLLGVQFVFAVELALNFVLDIYRPRLPGDEYTPSYESRLFALLAEPSRVGHSIADTVNYQFGFEVSSTWFYQLVSRAITPLVVFAVLVMFAMSSVVVVDEGEQYLVKHWGQLNPKPLGAGIHLKYPWPIDTAERFDTGMIHELVLGVGEQMEVSRTKTGEELILWTQEHGYNAKKERDFLIGVPPRDQSSHSESHTGKAPSVSIIKLVVLVQYRITNPYHYIKKYTNSRELLKCIAEQEMVQYCASATLDTKIPGLEDRPQAIMTSGRLDAAATLEKRIRSRVGDLGVEVTFVGIVSAHPSSEAVPQFEKVLEAERLQDQQRYKAEAEAAGILAEVSGNSHTAMELFLALHKTEVFDELSKLQKNPTEFAKLLDGVIRYANGQIDTLRKEIRREELLGKKLITFKSEAAKQSGKDEEYVDPRIKLQRSYTEFLAQLITIRDKEQKFDYAREITAARNNALELFDHLEGEPAKRVAAARADRWKRQLQEFTAVEVYRRKLLPYTAAPRVYMFDRYMDVMDETLPGMLKYVVGIDKNRLEVRVDLERQRDIMESGLDAAQNAGN